MASVVVGTSLYKYLFINIIILYYIIYNLYICFLISVLSYNGILTFHILPLLRNILHWVRRMPVKLKRKLEIHF